MKNVRMILALLLAVLLLAGCSSSTVQEPHEQYGGKAYLSELTLFNNNAFYVNATGASDAAAVAEWENYMSSIYGFPITLRTDVSRSGLYGLAAGGETGGLAFCQGYQVARMATLGQILPLEGYLKDNAAWNALPESLRNSYLSDDGHIYAVPTGDVPNAIVGMLRADWLEAVHRETPTTLAELLAVGRAFAENDVNGDGIVGNDYLLGDRCGVNQFLLRVLGMDPVDSTGYSLGYDPDLGCYIDNLFTEEAEPALQTVREMYEAGMIDPLCFTDYEAAEEKTDKEPYGLFYTWLSSCATCYSGWRRTHLFGELLPYSNLSDAQLQQMLDLFIPLELAEEQNSAYFPSSGGYVLFAAIAEPKKTVNFFVDMLFASLDSYLECLIGLPSHYTIDSQKKVVVKYENEAEGIYYPMAGIAASYLRRITADFGYWLANEGQGDGYVRYCQMALANSSALSERMLNSGKWKAVSPFYCTNITVDTTSSIQYSLNTYWLQLLRSLPGDTPIAELIADYREGARMAGVAQLLAEANELAGLPNKQDLG